MAKSVAQWREEVLNLKLENVRLETSLKSNQDSIERLEKRCSDQHEQILRLQDALVAREAPDAYADRKVDEQLSESVDEDLEDAARERKLGEINREMIDMMGADHTFNDAEHMMDMLTGGMSPTFEPTHTNDES